MGKGWVWTIAIAFVVAAGAWNSSVGITFDLTKLESVCLRISPLDADARNLGLSEERIGDHAFINLKDKLPRLQVERYRGTDTGKCAYDAPRLWVGVDIVPFLDARHGYFGMLEIRLLRMARWESGKVGRGIAFEANIALRGPSAVAPNHVSDGLDSLLREFAAEYYKAGNP